MKNIVISKEDQRLQVNILTPNSFYRNFVLSNPNRIIIDVHNISKIESDRYIDVNNLGIKAIRVGLFQPTVARIVFDLDNEKPVYTIEKIQDGIKVTFFAEPSSQEEREGFPAAEIEKEIQKVEEKRKIMIKTEIEDAWLEQLSKEIKESANITSQKLEESKEILDKTNEILKQIQDENIKKQKKAFRVVGTFNYFSPSEGEFKDVYKDGMMIGAELNFRMSETVDFWLAIRRLHKYERDISPGHNKEIFLRPIEAGLKYKPFKGTISPYIGFGVGYHLYKEINLSSEIDEKEIGYIGQIGCLFNVFSFLYVDIHLMYRNCQIVTESSEIDINGFHMGVGYGFDF
ncbi:AMIN domain-containing protein [Acidobacteriota bacterium]